MSENDDGIVLVFDCGSTNLKVVAVNSKGKIAAWASLPNSPSPQKGEDPRWLIWDIWLVRMSVHMILPMKL